MNNLPDIIEYLNTVASVCVLPWLKDPNMICRYFQKFVKLMIFSAMSMLKVYDICVGDCIEYVFALCSVVLEQCQV